MSAAAIFSIAWPRHSNIYFLSAFHALPGLDQGPLIAHIVVLVTFYASSGITDVLICEWLIDLSDGRSKG